MTSLPYVVPFGVFIALLALRGIVPLPVPAWQALWIGGAGAAILTLARPVLDFRVRRWAATLAVGVAVFALWIAPDVLFPGYRNYWLFTNPLMGSAVSSLPEAERGSTLVVALRASRAVIIVPIVEELFWRGWLPRWLIRPDFAKVALGTYSPRVFWITALLFASEHGVYWDVGLAAGIVYNWWMLRTRSLGDLMLAHAVTNACLSAFVLATGRWEYW